MPLYVIAYQHENFVYPYTISSTTLYLLLLLQGSSRQDAPEVHRQLSATLPKAHVSAYGPLAQPLDNRAQWKPTDQGEASVMPSIATQVERLLLVSPVSESILSSSSSGFVLHLRVLLH